MKQNFPFPIPAGQVTGKLFQSIDWSKNPLGPIDGWPGSLKTALSILFYSRHPMFLWWGPELIQFYNDGYLPSFGNTGKHPTAMGQAGRDCWGEIWPVIWPQIDDVMNRAIPSWNVDQLIPIYRNDRLEEVYWTYGYSPIFLSNGTVGGTLVVCTETTWRVLSDRRIRTLESLTEKCFVTGNLRESMVACAAVLGSNRSDIAFALLYAFESGAPTLVASTGVENDADEAFNVKSNSALAAQLNRAAAGKEPVQPCALRELFPQLKAGPYPEPAVEAMVMPVAKSGSVKAVGYVVIGLSPRQTFDANYREFLVHLTTRLAESELKHRADELERSNKELRGLVPICAWCKNIRDDKDYWQSVEQYVSDRSEAQFSHAICPPCFEKEFQKK